MTIGDILYHLWGYWPNVAMFLLLLCLGAIFGTFAERRHLKSIAEREEALKDIRTSNQKNVPGNAGSVDGPLVSGFVVISNDYLKNLFCGIRQIFGGRIESYETLVKRAKREAVLRLKDEARAKGAHAVYNVRIDTSSISKGWSRGVISIEAFAYGTAVK